MKTVSTFAAAGAIFALTACGGGNTAVDTDPNLDANGVATAALTGQELEAIFTDLESEAGEGTAAAVNFGDDFGEDAFENVEVRDITAAGSASYTGIIALTNIDVTDAFDMEDEVIIVVEDEPLPEEDDPTFVVAGRSVMNVTFGANPSISGGANGFIGINLTDEAALEAANIDFENADVADVIAALPTVEVDGSLTYSGGELIDFDEQSDSLEDLAIGFDVDGSMTLPTTVTGADSAETLNVDGRGLAGFTNTVGLGLIDLGEANGGAFGGFVAGTTGD